MFVHPPTLRTATFAHVDYSLDQCKRWCMVTKILSATTEGIRMKFFYRLLIAFLTFTIGVRSTPWRYLLRNREPAPRASSRTNSPVTAPDSVDETEEETQDGWAYEQGTYLNPEYGYSVTIPDGLTAYRSPVPMPQHGVAVDLSKPHETQVWIDGSYNSLEWGSLREAANDNFNYLKADDVAHLRIARMVYGRLSGLRAVRFVATYNKSGLPMIEDEIFAFRNERDIVYTLGLKTTAARYSEDVKVLNQLQSTFHLEALPYP